MIKQIPALKSPGELRRLNQAFPERYPFLLQSTARGGDLGRFDILFAAPGDALVLDSAGEGASFLDELDRWWLGERSAAKDTSVPFHGGWFLYLGYELAAEIEPSLTLHDDPDLPVAFAVRCRAALVYEHESESCFLVRESIDDVDEQQLLEDIGSLGKASRCEDCAEPVVSEDEPEDFTAAVSKAKEYIADGDVYQANLSREWRAEVANELSSEEIYEALCSANPAPFAGIARWQNASIISSSPERLLSVRDGIAATRPIAGTRPRGADSESDDHLSSELIAHPKERAEHVMLIDLERNDLGRVCEAGTVEVDEMMVIESYAHVHHIVSNVRGKLRDEVSPGKAIAAVFPGGTITGCPKVRCMEIISELESAPRGAYTGSFGYLNRDGSLDLNILIRTIVKHGNDVRFRAGAGIVADSEPVAELAETRAKAKGMLRALRRD